MNIYNKSSLIEFYKKHAAAKIPLEIWYEEVGAKTWTVPSAESAGTALALYVSETDAGSDSMPLFLMTALTVIGVPTCGEGGATEADRTWMSFSGGVVIEISSNAHPSS